MQKGQSYETVWQAMERIFSLAECPYVCYSTGMYHRFIQSRVVLPFIEEKEYADTKGFED